MLVPVGMQFRQAGWKSFCIKAPFVVVSLVHVSYEGQIISCFRKTTLLLQLWKTSELVYTLYCPRLSNLHLCLQTCAHSWNCSRLTNFYKLPKLFQPRTTVNLLYCSRLSNFNVLNSLYRRVFSNPVQWPLIELCWSKLSCLCQIVFQVSS